MSSWLSWLGQCQALGCTHDGSSACSWAPGCFSPPGHGIRNVWGYAYSAITSQNASCPLDGLNDFDLEPTSGRAHGKIHWLP